MVINRSRIETYLQCHRKYYYTWVKGLVKPVKAEPLRIGSTIHRFMEYWYSNIDMPKEERWKIAWDAALAELLRDRPPNLPQPGVLYENRLEGFAETLCSRYVKRYGTSEDFAVLQPEVECDAPLGHGHILRLRTDAVIERKGKQWILEHKTTARFGPAFLKKFQLNHQIIIYHYGVSSFLKLPIMGVCVNILIKARDLAHDYYREWVVITRAQTRDAIETFTSVADEIQSRDPNEPREWTLNTERCHDYGECPFWSVCALGARAEPDGQLYSLREPDYVDDPTKHDTLPAPAY